MGGVTESLAGRAALLELETMSLAEIAAAQPASLEAVAVRGGFTELPAACDATSLYFVRDVVGGKRVERMIVACGTPNAYPLGGGARAESPADWI